MNKFKLGDEMVFELDTKPQVLDATGQLMIVGQVYEMYAPIAQLAEENMGLVFDDRVNYSFIYTGVFYDKICADGVAYSAEGLGKHGEGHAALFRRIGTEILCPVYIAEQYIRPLTSE